LSKLEQAQPLSGDKAQTEGLLPMIQVISDLVEKRSDRFLNARYGLTTPQFQLLMAAVENSDVTLGGLSDSLGCSRGNVTGIVDRLERDEWLKRERSTDDRRVITVRLTDKGDRVKEIEQELVQELSGLSQVWDDQQRQALWQLLIRMYHELKD
jgi:DNA-binding MarR family transcriptional regulator